MKIVPEIRGISDPYSAKKAIVKQTINANQLDTDDIHADVIIIGTGAGGGTSAEILAQAGLKVLMIEEGPLKSTRDFKMASILFTTTLIFKMASILYPATSFSQMTSILPPMTLFSKIPQVRLVVAGALLQGAAFVVLTFTHNNFIAVISYILLTFGEILFYSPLTSVLLGLTKKKQGKLMGGYLSVYAIAALLAPLIGTNLYAISANVLWVVLGILGLASALLVGFLRSDPSSGFEQSQL